MLRREFLRRGLAVTAAAALSRLAGGAGAQASQDASRHAFPPIPSLHGLTGRIVLPNDTAYADSCAGNNSAMTSFPAAIVFCSRTEDVVNAVNWARDHGVPLRARCGRHSYEGWSSVDGGIVIDVSGLRGFHYDAPTRNARLGSGLTLGDAYEALDAHGMTFPGGSCPTVGISGHALGGGYGLLARRLGLACDSVLEQEVVVANGQVVRANSKENPDLYWAMRGGGGGNFGIVTSFVFKAHPIDKVSLFRMTFPWRDMEAVFDAWQRWAPVTDDRLTSVLLMRSIGDDFLAVTGQFIGSPKDLMPLLRPLNAAAAPMKSSVYEVPFIDAVRIFSGQKPIGAGLNMHWTPDDRPFKNSSDYANQPLSADGIAVLRNALQNAPNDGCFIQLEAYGGAIGRVGPSDTAFVHREAILNLQYQTYWNPGHDAAPLVAWVENLRAAMRPYVSGGAYCNYCDSNITNWQQAYYGDNLSRLVQVKRKYDPDNLFRFPQSIPLTI